MIGPGAGVRGPNPTPLISGVRVCEDGVKPIKPEAKCDWARGRSEGDQFLRLGGKPFHRGASNQIARVRKQPSHPTRRGDCKGQGRCKGTNREGQVLGVQYPTPFFSGLFPSLRGRGKFQLARGDICLAPGQVLGVQYPTLWEFIRDSSVTGVVDKSGLDGKLLESTLLRTP